MNPEWLVIVSIAAGIFGGFCYGLVNKYGWKESTEWLRHLAYGGTAGFLAWLTLQATDAMPGSVWAVVEASTLAGFAGLTVLDAFFGVSSTPPAH